MALQNIFIAGMQKCGTTSLAEWMVAQGLADYRVAGEKEPYLYANDEAHPARVTVSNLPLLDASVSYAGNPDAIRRLPQYDTQIILCLRNQLDRIWSAYKMCRLLGVDNAQSNAYFSSFQPLTSNGRNTGDQLNFERMTIKKHYPRRSHGFVDHYIDQELAHILSHDFAARVDYELGFYLTRRQFPVISIVDKSFYYFPLRTFLEKYQPSDISVLSVKRLGDAATRHRFVESVFEKSVDTAEVPVMFTSSAIDIDQPQPDFNDPRFDVLRKALAYDLSQARGLIAKTRFGDSLLDNAELDRYWPGA